MQFPLLYRIGVFVELDNPELFPTADLSKSLKHFWADRKNTSFLETKINFTFHEYEVRTNTPLGITKRGNIFIYFIDDLL